jgi:nucleotide-binding universal stress UspA family protein
MLPPKMILCPVDFSTHSDEALKVATDLAVQFGAALCLVHVVPAIPKISTLVEFFHEGEYEKELHKNAAERLGQIANDIARKGITVTSQVGTANEAGMEILLAAEHNRADLIVISTHGMTGWHQLALGSVTEKVVRLAACPVLVLRAQPAAQASESSAPRDSVAASR